MAGPQRFVIRLADGNYFVGRGLASGTAFTSPSLKAAKTFPSRWAALGECQKGPASVFDRAAIVPEGSQEPVGAFGGTEGSPRRWKRDSEARDATEEGNSA